MPAKWTIIASGHDSTAPTIDADRPEVDPLVLESRADSVPPTWIDPMQEEFVVSHQEARPLLDTSSPVTVAQDMTDLPPSSLVQGMPP